MEDSVACGVMYYSATVCFYDTIRTFRNCSIILRAKRVELMPIHLSLILLLLHYVALRN